jgi:hypothetical protein
VQKKQIAKSWNRGIPANNGQYLFAEAAEDGTVSHERLGRVMVLPNGSRVAFVGNEALTATPTLVAFGPIPSLTRSLDTKDRLSTEAVSANEIA